MRTSALFPIALAVVLAAPARATTLVPLSVDQLVDASEWVVRGTVEEVWTSLDSNGIVVTNVQVDVGTVYKGEVPLETAILSQPGGTWAGRRMNVPGSARFSPGEDAIFFISQNDSGRMGLVGMVQGKWTVRLDPNSRSEIVQRFAVPDGRTYDHRFIPLPPPGERVALNAFESEIADRVAAGWDGAPIPGADPDKLRRISAPRPESIR